MRPAGSASAPARPSAPGWEVVESAGLDDTAGDGVDTDAAARELDREVTHQRLQRRLRRPDQDVVLEHPEGAETEIATIEDPSGIVGADSPCDREERLGVGVHRPVPVLVLGLERRADDPRRGAVDEDVPRAGVRDLAENAVRGDVAADQHRLRACRAQFLGGRFRGLVVPHVADPDALGAALREPQRDRLADPARAARHKDGRALHPLRGSGLARGRRAGDPVPAHALVTRLGGQILGLGARHMRAA